jgi:hypothetical protein
MNLVFKDKGKFKKRIPDFICALCLVFVLFFSIFQGLYSTDPHHWGLMFSNAKDLYDGKTPYKEIFIQYGILTTIIHTLGYAVGKNLISILCVTSVAYAIGLLFLYNLAYKILGSKWDACFVFLTCFMLHPLAIYPWSNYVAFPFMVAGTSLAVNSQPRKYQLFIAGTLMGLAILAREGLTPAIICFIFGSALVDMLFKDKTLGVILSDLFSMLSGLAIPIVLFYAYLNSADLIEYWYKLSVLLPKIYLAQDFSHVSSFRLFNRLLEVMLRAYLTFDFRWILISVVLAVNFFILVLFVFRVERSFMTPNLVKISVMSMLMLSSSLHGAEIFRIATGSVVGLVGFYAVLNFYKKTRVIFISTCLLLIPTLIYGNSGNYFLPSMKAIMENEIVTSPSYFKGQRWEVERIAYYKAVHSDLNDLKEAGCGIHYHYNETLDSFFQVLSPFEPLQVAPFVASKPMQALRPDLNPQKFIDRGNEIVIIKALPRGELLKYTPPEKFSIYAHYSMPYANFFPPNTELLILSPSVCLQSAVFPSVSLGLK